MVNGDPTRLQQVVLNLVINARNAMPDGGYLVVTLSDVRSDHKLLPAEFESGACVCLSVSDTGAGIADDVVTRIFEPFFTTRAPLGSGLGLSQVDGIIKQHGGTIDVETAVGVGTTFKIYLPGLPDETSETAVLHSFTLGELTPAAANWLNNRSMAACCWLLNVT